MGETVTKEIFKAPAKRIFEVLTDYVRYPEFLPEVKRTSVLDTKGDKKLVEFELSIIKTFRYQLWLSEKPFVEVSWKFHTGEIFKENTGSWSLNDLGDGRTDVTYKLSAKFGMFVPGMIEKKLIEVNLPSMMEAYRKRCEG